MCCRLRSNSPVSNPLLLHAVISPVLMLLIQFLPIILLARAQPPFQSPECKKAQADCEDATDCVHRLAVLQSACVTNTCQPQCRDAALNLYQNREGRALLRTDASCVPGRYELEKCGLLPNKSPKHCSLAKLICETDLQCNAKWEVFVSECEADTNEMRCPDKCHRHLNSTLETPNGAAFVTCTCTDKEDGRCTQLRDLTLHSCLAMGSKPKEEVEGPLPRPGGGTEEAGGTENAVVVEEEELASNRLSPIGGHPTSVPPSSHSQSDVPDAAISHVTGFLLLMPSLLLVLLTALAL